MNLLFKWHFPCFPPCCCVSSLMNMWHASNLWLWNLLLKWNTFFFAYNHARVHVYYFQRTFSFFFSFFFLKHEIWTSNQRWSNFKIALFIYNFYIYNLFMFSIIFGIENQSGFLILSRQLYFWARKLILPSFTK